MNWQTFGHWPTFFHYTLQLVSTTMPGFLHHRISQPTFDHGVGEVPPGVGRRQAGAADGRGAGGGGRGSGRLPGGALVAEVDGPPRCEAAGLGLSAAFGTPPPRAGQGQ